MTEVHPQTLKNWVVPLRACPSPDARIVFFPYAGGGPSAFRPWTTAIPEGVDVWAVQLPGRERRIREPAHRELGAVLEFLVPAVAGFVDRPTVFVGHSMGALIAFEVANALRAADRPLPALLVVSASPAPHWPRELRGIYNRSDAEVVEELVSFNGTQTAILNNRELMNLMLPCFRADFELTEKYEYRERHPLPIPVVAAGGSEDANVSLASLRAWRRHTACAFAAYELQGDHFSILQTPSPLQEIIVRGLRALMRS